MDLIIRDQVSQRVGQYQWLKLFEGLQHPLHFPTTKELPYTNACINPAHNVSIWIEQDYLKEIGTKFFYFL